MSNKQFRSFVAGGLSALLPVVQGGIATAQSLQVPEVTAQNENSSPILLPNTIAQALSVAEPVVANNSVEVPSAINSDQRPYAYTLGPGDQIQIDIFNVPEFSGRNGTHFIPLDGSVQFPWIGQVSLNGLTLAEATNVLTARYTPFINNPCDIQPCQFLTMQLLQPRPMRVNVTGEVNRPGVYVVGEPTGGFDSQTQTVTSAIQLAGGITQLADVRAIEVYRPQQVGDDVVFPVDFWALLQDGSLEQDVVLRDGDRIIVPTSTTINNAELTELATANISPTTIQVNVVGEVDAPGIVELSPNASMNQAILAAGGLAYPRAKTSKVDFIRLNPDGTVVNRRIPFELEDALNEETNPSLRHNDIIVVGRNSRTRISDFLGSLTAPLNPILSIGALFRLFDNN
ncbi:MAG: polysaccharide biosynthesis/export family protein [Cyanobacteria bacterium P01_F01_bin.150]